MTTRPNRITPGLRKPAGENARAPRQPIDSAIVLLRHLKPWAAPRLPDEDLACFDAKQRQIRPLPGQAIRDMLRRARRNKSPFIPAQRKPHPLDRLEEVRRRAPGRRT